MRARKKQRTREALADAALELFAERGFDATSVEDIADRAGVSARTFFRYFAAKDEALFVGHEAELDHWEATLRESAPGETLAQALRRTTLVIARRFVDAHAGEEGRAHLARRLTVLAAEPALARRSLAFDGLARKRAATAIAELMGWDRAADVRPSMVAAAAMAAVDTAMEAWFLQGHGSLQDAVHQAYDQMERLSESLAAPVGSATSSDPEPAR
ncbi:MAG: TetR family transcriptional regulator [Egibacteraceae bacterium]